MLKFTPYWGLMSLKSHTTQASGDQTGLVQMKHHMLIQENP